MMEYKGYLGKVTYDEKAHLLHGDVIGLRAVITFQGKNVDELEKAFKDSIDDYIEWCEARGTNPEKAFSGDWHI
jgi:predicted HicB family RNase H-like nuclease